MVFYKNNKSLGENLRGKNLFQKKAVETSVPPGTEEINLKAFDAGYNYGKHLVAEEKDKTKKKDVKSA